MLLKIDIFLVFYLLVSGQVVGHCPIGIDNYYAKLNKCLQHSGNIRQGTGSWFYARSRCLDLGGDLVTIHDSGTMTDLNKMFNRSSTSASTWIGLQDDHNEGQFMWTTGILLSKTRDYAEWEPPSPTYNLKLNCVYMDSNDKWHDALCSHAFQWICEYRDANRCLNNKGGCEHKCMMESTNVGCLCRPGFRSKNKYSCEDRDECTNSKRCGDAECKNTIGSYTCNCPPGKKFLDGLLKSCMDIDECETDNGWCPYKCHNTDGGYKCTCHTGYTPRNITACVDLDECKTNNGGCGDALCVNTEGSHKCECNKGFKKDELGVCRDIDECETNKGGCRLECANTRGSFLCSCEKGYKQAADSTDCVDIDECATRNGGCVNSRCVNTLGSSECKCLVGWKMENDDCYDVNECEENDGGCEQICVNEVGLRNCTCTEGFGLERKTHCIENESDTFFYVWWVLLGLVVICLLVFLYIQKTNKEATRKRSRTSLRGLQSFLSSSSFTESDKMTQSDDHGASGSAKSGSDNKTRTRSSSKASSSPNRRSHTSPYDYELDQIYQGEDGQYYYYYQTDTLPTTEETSIS